MLKSIWNARNCIKFSLDVDNLQCMPIVSSSQIQYLSINEAGCFLEPSKLLRLGSFAEVCT